MNININLSELGMRVCVKQKRRNKAGRNGDVCGPFVLPFNMYMML